MSENPKERFFEDVGKLFGSALSAGMHGFVDARKCGEEWVRECAGALLEEAMVVRRDEFEALRETVRRLEDELTALKAEISTHSASTGAHGHDVHDGHAHAPSQQQAQHQAPPEEPAA